MNNQLAYSFLSENKANVYILSNVSFTRENKARLKNFGSGVKIAMSLGNYRLQSSRVKKSKSTRVQKMQEYQSTKKNARVSE